tara:strand:- start:382 stop:1074 length:693 start_codon:yes stop_codon:yes gene_type:complete
MIEEIDFDTFLCISKNKYQIFVYDKNNLKNLYNEEIKINDEIELNNLSKFLDENIYKIEKMVNDFIRNIILIIEDDKVLSVGISIRKKNYEKNIDQKYLENSLIEVKNIFKENYQDQIIMHMIIVNNETNEKFSLNNASNNDDYLHLEVNFICISNSFTYNFDKLLEDHQINIGQYMSGSYIRSFFNENKSELSLMANQLNSGLNKNEVKLVTKDEKNKGFFERFFQLFS